MEEPYILSQVFLCPLDVCCVCGVCAIKFYVSPREHRKRRRRKTRIECAFKWLQLNYLEFCYIYVNGNCEESVVRVRRQLHIRTCAAAAGKCNEILRNLWLVLARANTYTRGK